MAVPFNPGLYHTVGGVTYERLKTIDIFNKLAGQDPNIRRSWCNNFALDLFSMGNAEEICSFEYSHFEEPFESSYPKLQVTTAGASASATATFTVAPSPQGTSVNPLGQILQYPNNAEPFGASTGYNNVGMPVKVGDIIHIPNLGGTVSMDTYIDAYVLSVDLATGTFVAQSTTGDAIPAMASATEIIIIDNVNEIGGCDYECGSLDSNLVEWKNNLQDLKFCYESDTLWDNVCHTLMTPDGKRYLGLRDHLIPKYMELAKRKINFALLLGQHITNPALVSTIGAKSLRTRGLIPEVLQNGVVQGYSATTGFGKEDLRDLALRIKERQLCSSTYMLYAGIHLKNAINDTFGTETNGQYQVLFNGCEDKCYSNAFTFLSDSGIDIHIKELDIANDTQTLGANGYSYPKEGLLVPVGTVAQSRKTGDGSFEKVASPYLGLKYFKNKFMDENFLDHRTFSHCDKISVSLETMVGLDVTASNAFGLIKVQA